MKNTKLKALLLNEYYSLKVIYICAAVISVCTSLTCFAFTAGSGDATPGFCSVTSAITILLFSSAFGMDKYKGIGEFRRSMPYELKDFVTARFIPPVILTAFTVVSQLIFTLLAALMRVAAHDGISEHFSDQLGFSILFSLLFMSLPVIVFYPVFYRFDYQRSSLFFGLFCAFLMLSGVFISLSNLLGNVFNVNFRIPVHVSLVLMAVVIGLYVLSYRLSVKAVYERDAA